MFLKKCIFFAACFFPLIASAATKITGSGPFYPTEEHASLLAAFGKISSFLLQVKHEGSWIDVQSLLQHKEWKNFLNTLLIVVPKVFAADGTIVNSYKIKLYQADHMGFYAHPDSYKLGIEEHGEFPFLKAFSYFAELIQNSSSQASQGFLTIKPKAYPGEEGGQKFLRMPHIHLALTTLPGQNLSFYQLYFQDDLANRDLYHNDLIAVEHFNGDNASMPVVQWDKLPTVQVLDFQIPIFYLNIQLP